MKNDDLIELLKRCRPYVEGVAQEIEAIHDDETGSRYLDFKLFEIFTDADELLEKIDELIKMAGEK